MIQHVNMVKRTRKWLEDPKLRCLINKPRHFRYRIPKVVEVHSIHNIVLLGSCTSLELCNLVDKRSFQSDLHPLLFVEGLTGFLSLNRMLNLL